MFPHPHRGVFGCLGSPRDKEGSCQGGFVKDESGNPFSFILLYLALDRLIDPQKILRENGDCKQSNENLLWDNLATNYCQVSKADGLTMETSKEK